MVNWGRASACGEGAGARCGAVDEDGLAWVALWSRKGLNERDWAGERRGMEEREEADDDEVEEYEAVGGDLSSASNLSSSSASFMRVSRSLSPPYSNSSSMRVQNSAVEK